MLLLRANLKNVVGVFTGKLATSNVDMIYFLPMRAYDNGHHNKDACVNSFGRRAFDCMTRKQVKRYLKEYDNHYLIW